MEMTTRPSATALKERGTQLVNSGQLSEAIDAFLGAYSLNHRDTDALIALGVVNGMRGNYPDAEKYLRKATELDPELPAAYYNLAMAQKYQGNLIDAAASYNRAIACEPDNPASHNNLGNVLLELNDPDQAIQCFNKALLLEPDSPDYYYNLGKALKARGLRQESIDALNRALHFRPGFSAALREAGSVYLSLGKTPEAEKCYQTAVAINPDDHDAVAGLSSVFARRHRYDKACALLEPHLHNLSGNASVAIAFAGIAPYAGRETEAISLLEQQLLNNKDLSRDNHAQIHFRLGQFHDAMQQYSTAFEHFRQGNELRSAASPADDYKTMVEEIATSFNRDYFRNAPRPGHSSKLPIFIVGMPRSGTTLVEQILASHPQVYGAGELDTLPSLLNSIPERVGAEHLFPDAVKKLKSADIEALSGEYIEHVKALAPEAARITDKMPANFQNLGFIRLLFPNAHIIHCRRNPLDTCLSCYFQDFAGHLGYTSNLESLGQYYLQYDRLMKYWEDVLDISMLNVDYEVLVGNFEAECKRIIGFCKLEWDRSCLEFYKNDRIVATASLNQVNKPLYSSAVGRWNNYDEYIAPLKKILSDLARLPAPD
ncbi:MAG TPA: sulfotransferase family protein [Gammaproteobacteria bacterium]|nr:sulfotransferase family protein [Gammaproteobacteria bacterium]